MDFSISAYDSSRRYPIKNTQLDHWSTQRVYGTTDKLLFKPNDDLDVTLVGHYQVMTGNGFNFVYTYLTPGTTLRQAGDATRRSLVSSIREPSVSGDALPSFASRTQPAAHRDSRSRRQRTTPV